MVFDVPSLRLTTIFKCSSYDKWFSLDGDFLNVKENIDLVVDKMRVPGSGDVFGMLFEGKKMTIYKDVLHENGVMWYELRELRAEYLRSQRARMVFQKSPDHTQKVAVFGYSSDKRGALSLVRYLMASGIKVALFVEELEWREYKRLVNSVDVICPVISL